MSYAGPASRSRAGATASRTATTASGPSRVPAPRRPRPVETGGDTDWQQVAIFGAGLALGVLVGAGAALLTAPRTGAETRAALAAGARRTRRTAQRRSRDAWDDLRDEIRSATRALRRRQVDRERNDLEVRET